MPEVDAEPHPSPWGSVKGREQQRRVKREAVLRKAAQLFNEKSYREVDRSRSSATPSR